MSAEGIFEFDTRHEIVDLCRKLHAAWIDRRPEDRTLHLCHYGETIRCIAIRRAEDCHSAAELRRPTADRGSKPFWSSRQVRGERQWSCSFGWYFHATDAVDFCGLAQLLSAAAETDTFYFRDPTEFLDYYDGGPPDGLNDITLAPAELERFPPDMRSHGRPLTRYRVTRALGDRNSACEPGASL